MFDESKVKRVPRGQSGGGRFANQNISADVHDFDYATADKLTPVYRQMAMDIHATKSNQNRHLDASLKGHVVHTLAETLRSRGVRYSDALGVSDALIRAWAENIPTMEGKSAFWHQAAKDLFNTPTTPYIESILSKRFRYTEFEGVLKSLYTDETAQLLLTDVYKRTQALLEQYGVEEVILYRGVEANFLEGGKSMEGKELSMQSYPLSSWSLSPDIAYKFSAGDYEMGSEHGGYVLAARVPRSRIISMAQTGFGCYDELEMIIAPQNGDKIRVVQYVPEPEAPEDTDDGSLNDYNEEELADYKKKHGD